MKVLLAHFSSQKFKTVLSQYLMIFLLLGSLLPVTQVYSQGWEQAQKIVSSDRAGGDLFGCAVSISGEYAIVGARQVFDDAAGNNTNLVPHAGAAYFFELDGSGNWQEVQKIVASDRDTLDRFGWSAAISGNYAVVAAPMEAHDASGSNELFEAGSAYIFERDTGGIWQEVQKIVASDRDSLDNFGKSVAISGDYIIVSSEDDNEDENGTNTMSNAGSAYIFERNASGTWQEVQKIVASDRAIEDKFGISVSISGDHVIVGAHREDEDARGRKTKNNSGSAYVFERDAAGNWLEVDKIVASDRADTDFFGYSVSISGDYALVGAYSDGHSAGGNAGSAYIFERNARGDWKEIQKITASDAAPSDWFGYSVSISNTFALVSARSEDEDASGNNTLSTAGSAYVFEDDGSGTWQQVEKIVASDRAENDLFGYRVSISGDNAIVGAYYEDEDASGGNTRNIAGSAYLFNRGTCPDSDGDGVCDADDICPGYDDNIDTDGDGIPDGCDDCTSVSNAFPDDPLTHIGTGSTSTTYDYGTPGHTDVSFTISNIDARTNGNPSHRYVDSVTVTYTDAGGTQTYGIFSGRNTSSVNVDIPGPVYSVTIELEDGYDGDASVTLSIDPDSISSCPPPAAMLVSPQEEVVADDAFSYHINNGRRTELSISPNPTSEMLSIYFRSNGTSDIKLAITDLNGRVIGDLHSLALNDDMIHQLDVRHLTDGIYFLHLISKDGSYCQKFVVSK